MKEKKNTDLLCGKKKKERSVETKELKEEQRVTLPN